MKLGSFLLLAALVAAPAAAQAGKPDVAKLKNPSALTEPAPATYKVKFDTSAGVFVVEVHRAWAPKGADRFYNLVKNGFYDGTRFFRVVPGFMVQWGINGDPAIQSAWRNANIPDDPMKTEGNKTGFLTFANAGPNSRSTQIFINYKDNSFLDKPSMHFPPIGQVIEGMTVVEKINPQYREEPNQAMIQSQGNAYLNKNFPKLDYVKTATIEK